VAPKAAVFKNVRRVRKAMMITSYATIETQPDCAGVSNSNQSRAISILTRFVSKRALADRRFGIV
jgi:hypothetical protein